MYSPYSLKKAVFGLSLACSASMALAEDLLAIYQVAWQHNPNIQMVRESTLASKQALPIAVGSLLPQLSAGAQGTRNHSSTTAGSYPSENFSLTLSQPLFHLDAWLGVKLAKDEVRSAVVSLALSEQNLILQVSEAYFAILSALDNLHLSRTQKEAYASSLAQAQQKYKVGLIAITDVLTAQAAHDNATAQVIAAETALADVRESMRSIIGRPAKRLAILQENFETSSPKPKVLDRWVQQSLTQNLNLAIAKLNVAQAKTTMKVQWAGHMPTVDLSGQLSKGKNPLASTYRTKNQSVSLSLNVPLFSGGTITAKTRQAIHNLRSVEEQLEQTRFATESATRTAYLQVISQITRIKALKQAVVSNKSALSSIRASYEVGSSTMTDVLSAQSSYIQAEYNYKVARYDYIIQSLNLKLAAGSLNFDDLLVINKWLDPKKMS